MYARSVRSLADVPAGKTVEIVHILFDSLRHKYRRLGLRAGTRGRFERADGEALRLILPDGTSARIDEDQARFIEVRLIPEEVATVNVKATPRGRRPGRMPSPISRR